MLGGWCLKRAGLTPVVAIPVREHPDISVPRDISADWGG